MKGISWFQKQALNMIQIELCSHVLGVRILNQVFIPFNRVVVQFEPTGEQYHPQTASIFTKSKETTTPESSRTTFNGAPLAYKVYTSTSTLRNHARTPGKVFSISFNNENNSGEKGLCSADNTVDKLPTLTTGFHAGTRA